MITPKKNHDAERAFFDRLAKQTIVERVSEEIVTRYRNPGFLFPKEFAFRLLGNVRGKRILDVGCGDGENSILFARLGADVTGIDISQGAINLAQRRCAAEGVTAEFICSTVEELSLTGFDVVWVEAILHHVLHDLDSVLTKIAGAAKPGGITVIIEPLNLLPPLRRLRVKYLPAFDATPDERPLEAADMALIKRRFPDIKTRYYRGIGRLERLVLPDFLEHASLWRRWLIQTMAAIDYTALSLPLIGPLASVVVMWTGSSAQPHYFRAQGRI